MWRRLASRQSLDDELSFGEGFVHVPPTLEMVQFASDKRKPEDKAILVSAGFFLNI